MDDSPPWGVHDVTAHVIQHVSAWWPDREVEPFEWTLGDFPDLYPDFRVLVAHPAAPGEPWTYASAGAWEGDVEGGAAHEFVLRSPVEEPLHVEMLAALCNRQADPDVVKLRRGSVLELGEPWLEDATCDHMVFVDLPSDWPGDTFELEGLVVHFLLMLPVTAKEAAYAREHGADALEDMLGGSGVDVLEAQRPSVV